MGMNTRTIAENTACAISEINPLKVVAVMVAVAAFAMGLCEIMLSHDAAFTLAAGRTAGLLAIVAASAAFVKMIWLPGASYFWDKSLYVPCAAAVVFGIGAHIYSVQAVLSLAATGRDEIVSQRGQSIEQRDRVAERYVEAKKTVAKLAGSRHSTEVEKELRLVLGDVETAQTARAAATNAASVQLKTGAGGKYDTAIAEGRAAITKIEAGQKRLSALDAEHKASLQYEQARADMHTLSAQLDGITAPGNKDPQAAVMTEYLSFVGVHATERGVSLASLLPILALVELGGALAMTIASGLWTAGSATPAVTPSGGIAVATWAPTKQLPPPAELSQEEKTFREVRSMVVLSKDNKLIAGSGRKLSEHLEVPNATLAQYLIRWEANNRIIKAMENGQLVLSLPVRARVAAQREMATA